MILEQKKWNAYVMENGWLQRDCTDCWYDEDSNLSWNMIAWLVLSDQGK
jgi:hypothetical protein